MQGYEHPLTLKMIVKVHKTPNGRMLAICDSELLGKTFEEGDRQLNLDSQFYRGEHKTEEEITLLLQDVYVVNAVGVNAVNLLVERGLVKEGHVMKISGVPYAQCVVEPA